MDYRFVTQAGLQEQNWKTGCIRRIESNEMKQSGIELEERLALTEYINQKMKDIRLCVYKAGL